MHDEPELTEEGWMSARCPGRSRPSKRLLETGVVLVALGAASPAMATITNCSLNGDAPAQTRLMAYEAAKLQPSTAAPTVGGDQATENRVAANDLTAYEPYDLNRFPKARLLDWNTWPSRKMAVNGQAYEFMGLHITDKTTDSSKAPCIRIAFHIFAPGYTESIGVGILTDTWERNKPRDIRIRRATASPTNPISVVTYDQATERFYVIDLARLRRTPYWARRYELFKRNIQSATSGASYGTHFERFLLNVIRASRYLAQDMTDTERRGFVDSTRKALGRQRIDCESHPSEAACILNAVFMETELGPKHPLTITDALDNSGLAFGPRQLDLGQARKDATDFALKYLIEEMDKEDKWPTRFLKPIEQLSVRDLRDMYQSVIPAFNERLVESPAAEAVIDMYVAALIEMLRADYGLGRLHFEGGAGTLAQLLTADFSNKWGRPRAIAIVNSLSRTASYGECAFVSAWERQVRKTYGPSDLEDFDRRAGHVLRSFARATGADVLSCAAGSAVITSAAQ